MSPVPAGAAPMAGGYGTAGRDAPKRSGLGELSRRVAQRLPARVEPAEVRALLEAARGRALLT